MGIKCFLSSFSLFLWLTPAALANQHLNIYREEESQTPEESQRLTDDLRNRGFEHQMTMNHSSEEDESAEYQGSLNNSLSEIKIPLENDSLNTAQILSIEENLEVPKSLSPQLITEEVVTPPAEANLPNDTEQEAITQLNTEQSEPLPPDEWMTQVTSVSQLSDVQSTDWAFGALRSLVERYGCITGYPDGSFRGDRSLTRYEFAAGLNSCFGRLTERIANPEDLLTLEKLLREFSAELATLRGRVEDLETRMKTAEAAQFSPNASLVGEAIFGLSTASGGNPPGGGETNTILNHLTRLSVVSSFRGTDRLQFTLTTGNFDNFGFANPQSLNTYTALLNYQEGLNNDVVLNTLEYRFAAFRNRVVFTLKPVGFSLDDVLTANSPYIDAGNGAISRFAALNPIFRIGDLDAGLGFDWLFDDKTRLQVAYGTRNSGNASEGLFRADHSALGLQLLRKPNPNLITGLTYVNAYSSDGRLDTFTGSFNADTSGTFLEPAQIHALGGTVQWRLSPNLTLGAWGGFLYSNSLESSASALSGTAQVSLGVSDPFGRPGDLLGVLVGIPPKLLTGERIDSDEGTSLHFETFYRFQVSDRISITPGFFIVTDTGHISGNDSVFIGTIRTTFRF